MPTKAITRQLFKSHHKTAVIRSEEFLKTMTHHQPDIQCHLNQAMASRISLNRQKLHSIFKTIVFCGRQNIALHGHRDDATDIERDVDDLENHGNSELYSTSELTQVTTSLLNI